MNDLTALAVDWQSVIEAAPSEDEARSIYRLSESDWFLNALAAGVRVGGLDVERLTTVLYDWVPMGADVASDRNDGDTLHLVGADLAEFIFDRAREYVAPTPPQDPPMREHGYTCDRCFWGRAGGTRTHEDYLAHMAEAHR